MQLRNEKESAKPLSAKREVGVSKASRSCKSEITRPRYRDQPEQVRELFLDYATKTRKIEIAQAARRKHLEQVRGLFLEYAQSLGFTLCFQGFDKELAELPGRYAPPQGRLLLATINGLPAGCVALHKLEHDICEMKRLYTRPQFRGLGLGRQLTEKILAEARAIGYEKMRLDTIVGKMNRAIELYRQLGFLEINSYRPNPIPGALYMELEL